MYCNTWPLAGLPVCCRLELAGGGGGGRGFGGLDQVCGEAVVGAGMLEAGPAGRTGLASAPGAGRDAVAFIVGSDVQGGQEGLDLVGRDADGVLRDRFGRCAFGRGRPGLVVRAERVVLGAFIDVRQVADEQDGAAGVLVVGAGVTVAVKIVQDVVDQVRVQPLVGHARLLRWRRVGGLKSAATPVPLAGRQRLWGR
jgi:hypothetical protein